MNEQIFFEYLIGNWMIKRKIVNRLSSLFCANASGLVSITKENEVTLNYLELVTVKWANNFTSNAYKQYYYIIDDREQIGLYSCGHEGVSLMFNLFFDPKLKNLTKGQYQCVKDCYSARYKIINPCQFVLNFQVNGPEKDHSIISLFTRSYTKSHFKSD